MAWRPHSLGEDGLEQAWVLQDRYELSWWDSRIVASAWIQGCRHILTDNLQHNRDLGGVTVVNPFVVFPADMAARPKT
jgi:predicted nucleic acid-binding protein